MALNRQRNDLFDRLLGVVKSDTTLPRLPHQHARDQLQRLIDDFNATARQLAEAFAAGKITLAEFDTAMRAQIKQLHLGAAILGHGGTNHVTPATRLTAQNQVDEQLKFFENWVGELNAAQQAQQTANAIAAVGVAATVIGALANRQQPSPQATLPTPTPAAPLPSAAAIAARGQLYGAAANNTFSQTSTTALGVPPLPFYPGERSLCMVNCHCRWRIVPLKGNGDYDCYWELGIAEHCATCLARSRACSPLRVRNGVIMDAARFQAANLYA